MELGLILYWLIFYSALVGWYARTAPIIRGNSSVDFNRYMVPRILLSHVMAGYILLLILHAFSLLHENIWVLFFPVIATLASTEYFWIRLGNIRSKIIESITVKLGMITLGILIFFYFSSASGTHLELLTKVSPGVFGPFETLLTFTLSSVAWMVLVQLSLTAFSVIYLIKLCLDKDDYIENMLFITVSGLTASFFLVLGTKAIFNNAIPYIFEEHFVAHMYHSNEGLDKKLICSNIASSEQIVLLPSGGVSIATRNNQEEWVFTVDVCEREVNKSSQADT
ncbi:hypothetical protein DFO74_1574 [Chromohalobacter israelensis]|nr:hypothetical protein DFO74_1574 [Chromohalobacter salexigens]